MKINIMRDMWYYSGVFLVVLIIFSIFYYIVFKIVNYIILLISLLIVLIIKLIFKQKSEYEINKKYHGFIFLFFINLFIIMLDYYKHPIFPRYESGDFIVHLSNVLRFMKGGASLKGLANPAIDMLLATLFSFRVGNPIMFSRLFMVIISLMSFWFAYEIGVRLSNNVNGGLIVSIMVIFFNPFWYLTIYTTGLYSNLLGITIELFTILYIIDRIRRFTLIDYPILFLIGLALLFSHSSTILIFISLWLSSIYIYIVEGENYLFKPTLILSLPLIIIFIAFPNLIYRLPTALQGPFGALLCINTIAQTLEVFSPFLAFLYRYSGFTFLTLFFLSIGLSLYLIIRRKLSLISIIFFWLILSWIGSLISINVWRFALIALTPLCLFSGIIYEFILYPIYYKIVRNIKRKKLFNYIFITLLLIFLIGDSYIPGYFAESLYYANDVRVKQFGVYEAMIWLRDNTPINANIMSIGRWEFMFTPIIANRSFLGDSLAMPNVAYQLLITHKPGYVAVWNLLNENGIYYVSLYKESGLFKEVWHNDVVTIFMPIYENSTGSS